MAEGDWSQAETCLRHGLNEFRIAAGCSGHPVFTMPLYDGVVDLKYPKSYFRCVLNDREAYGTRSMSQFVDSYQRFMAFTVPKEFKVVYARSIDIADYYRRHFRTTPRTIFVSKTDHVQYDKWWLCHWGNDRILVPREKIPTTTRISSLMSQRRDGRYFKDPLSYEFILVEDQCRSIRFERESPNPIWWFDYTLQHRNTEGSIISQVETPDVDVLVSKWARTQEEMSLKVRMVTEATFEDYAIALWDLPPEFHGDLEDVETDAKECVVARNCDGECHLVLFFDLKPDLNLYLLLKC